LAVTLREWLESQRLEQSPHRAALNEAMETGDTRAIADLLAEAPFTTEQRKYIADLLARWDEPAAKGTPGMPGQGQGQA
jgi:hypothetical protein